MKGPPETPQAAPGGDRGSLCDKERVGDWLNVSPSTEADAEQGAAEVYRDDDGELDGEFEEPARSVRGGDLDDSFPGDEDDPPRPRLMPIRGSDAKRLPKKLPLIAGVLDQGAMSLVYGGSNTGKSFTALDVAACVSLGLPWHGRKVRCGAAIYIAAEGGIGISERLAALQRHHGIDPGVARLYVIPDAIDLCRSEDAETLVSQIGELPIRDSSPELIVIDTLSRALAGGTRIRPTRWANSFGAAIGFEPKPALMSWSSTTLARAARAAPAATASCAPRWIPRSRSRRTATRSRRV